MSLLYGKLNKELKLLVSTWVQLYTRVYKSKLAFHVISLHRFFKTPTVECVYTIYKEVYRYFKNLDSRNCAKIKVIHYSASDSDFLVQKSMSFVKI